MVLGCCFLFWFFSSAPKQSEPIPTDGLIEAVASVKESMVSDAAKDAAVRISEMRAKVELSGNSGQLGHIVEANKKVDPPQPSPSDKPKVKKEIIIFTRPNCPPCDRWKRCEQAKFEADGWTFAYCDDHNYAITPTFLIDANGKQTEHRGYLPIEKVKEVIK